MNEVIPVFDSVAEHLSAKLQLFQTDERTLTDELCDMSCIWIGNPSPVSTARGFPPTTFDLDIRKTTPREERRIGADLEVVLMTPSGLKRALFQAKVVNPNAPPLRLNTPGAWAKLRQQLIAMRANCPLSYLLLYLPGNELDGRPQGYGTYEQGFLGATPGNKSSRFGATAITVDALLNGANRWVHPNKLAYVAGSGGFLPVGKSFTCILLELITCATGTWTRDKRILEEDSLSAYRRLAFSVSAVDESRWEETCRIARSFLREVLDDVEFHGAT
jgi:hypothetical protein